METPDTKASVLCVDDEPQILEGLQLILGRRYAIRTAVGAEAGLLDIESHGTPHVIVSDMRMPGMDGSVFLARCREIAPLATRILLTGQADMDSAIAAVNEGQIFRFLTKPCPPPTLLAAVATACDQYRLITAEKVLLEQTLHGCIQMLSDILSLSSPLQFGRATRIKTLVSELCPQLNIEQHWQIEVAALLSQLGAVTLPTEVAEKLYRGKSLDAAERTMVERASGLAHQLLAHIPRMEIISEILSESTRAFRRQPPPQEQRAAYIDQAAMVLRLAQEFDHLESRGLMRDVIISSLNEKVSLFDPTVLNALAQIRPSGTLNLKTTEVELSMLKIGMVVDADVRLANGTLLVSRGYTVTRGFMERVGNFGNSQAKLLVRVIVPPQK